MNIWQILLVIKVWQSFFLQDFIDPTLSPVFESWHQGPSPEYTSLRQQDVSLLQQEGCKIHEMGKRRRDTGQDCPFQPSHERSPLRSVILRLDLDSIDSFRNNGTGVPEKWSVLS